MIQPPLSKFINTIKDEDNSAMTKARQIRIRTDAVRRKARYIIDDRQILSIIRSAPNLDSDNDVLYFLRKIAFHLQKYQAAIPTTLPNDDDHVFNEEGNDTQ